MPTSTIPKPPKKHHPFLFLFLEHIACSFSPERNRHLLLNTKPKPFQTKKFLRPIRKNSQLRQPQIPQNLRPDPKVAPFHRARRTTASRRHRSAHLFELMQPIQKRQPTRLLPQIHQSPPAGRLDHLQRSLKFPGRFRTQSPKNIAKEVSERIRNNTGSLSLHHRFPRRRLNLPHAATTQRKVNQRIAHRFINTKVKWAKRCLDRQTSSRRTAASCCNRYSIKSAIVHISKPCFAQNFSNSRTRLHRPHPPPSPQ